MVTARGIINRSTRSRRETPSNAVWFWPRRPRSWPVAAATRASPSSGGFRGKSPNKGQPVAKGLVTFIPVGGPGATTGQSATGEIGKDGSFSVSTFENNDGAVLGEHIVVVQSREDDPALEGRDMPIPDAQGRTKTKPPKNLVPEKYAVSEKSPLRQTVVAGGNTFTIELKD